MSTDKSNARAAGWLYLGVAATGGFSMLYVPSLIVPGNAPGTVAKVLAHEFPFRLAIVSGLTCQVLFVFLGLTLHRLFRAVSETQAAAMKSLVLTAVPVGFLNLLSLLAALHLAKGGGYLANLGADQRNLWTMFLLDLHAQGLLIVEVFWGLWLAPLGLLVIKSRFLPAILGWLLLVACGGYLLEVLMRLLLPDAAAPLAPVTGLAKFGEVVMILWLVIKGVRPAQPAT